MTEDELDAIEDLAEEARTTGGVAVEEMADTADALVAEVRRLRAELSWTAPEDVVFARGGKPMYWNNAEQRWQREPVTNVSTSATGGGG